MKSALIGYTGFVGACLAQTGEFDLLVNRTDADSLRGMRLERLVCAALPATSHVANQNVARDADQVHRLEATLSGVWARRCVLISTLEVYPCRAGVDETYDCTQKPNHAYGTHRLELEQFVQDRFEESIIVRLPRVFGRGARPQAVADLCRQLQRLHPDSRLQWYPLDRLPEDLLRIEQHRLSLVNLCTEPLATRVILESWFPGSAAEETPDLPVCNDLHTCHGGLFGGDLCYVLSASAVLGAFGEFVNAKRQPPAGVELPALADLRAAPAECAAWSH